MKKSKNINFLISVFLIAALIIPLDLPVSMAQAATHTHTEDCYKEAYLHTCTGSAFSGGGCYGKPVYHTHSSSCPTHIHTGSASAGGGCYGTPNYHKHSSSCPTHVHTGSASAGGGCYGTPVYHTHTNACGDVLYVPNDTTMTMTWTNESISPITIEWRYSISGITTHRIEVNYCPANGYGAVCLYKYRENTGDWVLDIGWDSRNVGESSNNRFNDAYYDVIVPLVKTLKTNTNLASLATLYPDPFLTILPNLGAYNSLAGNTTQITSCGKTTSAVESYALSCGQTAGAYTCGKATSTVESYSLHCGKNNGDYLCGKTTATIESYLKSCGKESGKYYTASGLAASLLCDKIVISILPNTVNIPYNGTVTKGTAKAVYLDGHTGTVEVMIDNASEKASYSGLVKNANTGNGTLMASVTINRIPIQSFKLNNKTQILYKGQNPDLSGVASYGAGGTAASLAEHTTSNFNSDLFHTIQNVTVSVNNGAVATDTMKVLVLPKPISLEAVNIKTTKGEDKSVVFSVHYEDGSSKELSFLLSDVAKTYTENYEIGTVSSDFSVTWSNNNKETGLDYRTGGEYTLALNYEGITRSIEVKVYDSCTANTNHKEFAHDVCPVCEYISNHQKTFDNHRSELMEIKNLVQSNINFISQKNIPTEADIINRDKEAFELLSQDFEKAYGYLTKLKQKLDTKITEFNNKWVSGSDIAELENILTELEEYKNSIREQATENYNIANDKLTSMNELKDHKNAINSFTPEITISGNLNKVYDKQPVIFEAEVTKTDFDKEFINPVTYFLYNGTDWTELTESELRQFINVGDYTIKAVTQDMDYPVAEKEFTISIQPKELFVKYSNETKIYDGTDKALLHLQVEGVVNGDDVMAENLSGTYSQTNIGTDLEITPTADIILAGEDAHNYFAVPTAFAGTITPAALTISTEVVQVPYGEIPKQFTYTFDGLVQNETPDMVMENITLTANVLSAKAGKQPVDVKCEVTAPVNYHITMIPGEIVFTVPDGYQKIEINCLPNPGNGSIFVDGVKKQLEVPYEIWHPTNKDIIVEKDGYQYNVAADGTISLVIKGNGEDIAISGNAVQIGSVILPHIPNIILSGNGTVFVEHYNGEIKLENFTANQDITISDNSKTDLIMNGNITVNGNLIIDTNSFVTISGTGSLTLTENIIVEKNSSVTINGSGSITANGIGGTQDKPSGSVIINGGDIHPEFIGNHPDYPLSEREKLPDIIINGGKLDVNEWIGNLFDKNGTEFIKVEIPYNKIPKKDIIYTKNDNKNDGPWYTAVLKDKVIIAIVNKDAKKIYVNIDDKLYYVDLTKSNLTLVSDVNTQGSSSTGSFSNTEGSSNTSSSSNAEGSFSIESPSNTESSSHENMDVFKIQESINEIFVNAGSIILQKDGKTYINTDTLTLKEGYMISENGKDYSDMIHYKQCKTIFSYRIWIKNMNSFVKQSIYLGDTIIDYKNPTAQLKCSVSKMKLSEKEKVKYSYYTNKKIKFELYDFDFGISGKNKVEYQIVKKGKKLNKDKWKTLKDNYFHVKPSGYMQVFIRLTNQAGNQTILKTTGFKSDKTAPELKQNGWIIQGVDTNSGVKKVVVNGKKVKNKYQFTKAGTYTVTVYDKAGNKTTKKIKITKDKTKPIIQFENNKITVTDHQSGIKKVTVNGKKAAATKTLKKKGTYKVVAYDKTGNKAVKKIIVE